MQTDPDYFPAQLALVVLTETVEVSSFLTLTADRESRSVQDDKKSIFHLKTDDEPDDVGKHYLTRLFVVQYCT